VPVPLIFTVRTDTREGVLTILRAAGLMLVPMTQAQLEGSIVGCKLDALQNGDDPNASDSLGMIDTADGRGICFSRAPMPRQALEAVARRMIPPRRLLAYDPAKRTATFGPAGLPL